MADLHDGPEKGASGWMERLATRWGISRSRVLVVVLVFACTGFSVMYLKRPLMAWVAENGEPTLLFSILYWILILPFYNVLLLVYGAVFGQFRFFWAFEKRFFRRLLKRGQV